ncbi:DUF3397 domain-containing protein [Salirhabdus salicampi]|uniref:DUF3397 domain-containing protein n=1 Tax=Salirhabdus salicampi TaxID=476102 RepID=UPI0020C53983|nr:DUF3397 domain-containing protein [Salirhabdus salicampi]MCP8616614.1 DUF3397 domain-containing protein [Salirhabdus salicampi]
MSDIIVRFIAIFITMPILAFCVVYMVKRKRTNQKEKAFLLAIDVTVVFIFLSVYFSFYMTFKTSILSISLIVFLSLLGLFTTLQWKIKGEVLLKKALKGVWRLSFFLFFGLYLFIIIYGIFIRIKA